MTEKKSPSDHRPELLTTVAGPPGLHLPQVAPAAPLMLFPPPNTLHPKSNHQSNVNSPLKGQLKSHFLKASPSPHARDHLSCPSCFATTLPIYPGCTY